MSLCRGHIAWKELRASQLFLRVKVHAHRFTLLGTKLHVRCYIEHAHRRRCNSWFWTLCVFPTGGCVCVSTGPARKASMTSRRENVFGRGENAWEKPECLVGPSFQALFQLWFFTHKNETIELWHLYLPSYYFFPSWPKNVLYWNISPRKECPTVSFFSHHQQNQILIRWLKTKCFDLLRWLTTNSLPTKRARLRAAAAAYWSPME